MAHLFKSKWTFGLSLLTDINIRKVIRQWKYFGIYSAVSALRDRDSANIVKLQTSTFCRALHH